MSGLGWGLIAAVVLPALVIVLWPVLRGAKEAAATTGGPRDDRRLELEEEKAAIYRALKELDFDHEAGHLSDDDYRSLRERYELRAAALITELDALGGVPRPVRADRPLVREGAGHLGASAPGWTRRPVTLAAGAALLLVFGVIIGVNAGRFTEPDMTMTPPGSRLPAPLPPGGAPPVGPAPAVEPGKPIPPEMLAGMLQAARQSLLAGQYQQAIAAYQAVLKRDARNVDAMTHLGLIVALGGHADPALETFDRALALDPRYAPAYLYRGQVLYEQKQDYAGAVKAWERFMSLVPDGADHDRVAALIQTARGKQQGR